MRGATASLIGLLAGLGLTMLGLGPLLSLSTRSWNSDSRIQIQNSASNPGTLVRDNWDAVYQQTTMHRVLTEIPGPIRLSVVFDTEKGIIPPSRVNDRRLYLLNETLNIDQCLDDEARLTELEPIIRGLIQVQWEDTANVTELATKFAVDCKLGIVTWLKAIELWDPMLAAGLAAAGIRDPNDRSSPAIHKGTALIIPISPKQSLKAWPSLQSFRTLAVWPEEIVLVTALRSEMNDLYPMAALLRMLQCHYLRFIPKQVRLRYIVVEGVGGPMAARYLGALITDAPILLTFDADDYMAPGTIFQRALMFDRIPDLDYLLGHYKGSGLSPTVEDLTVDAKTWSGLTSLDERNRIGWNATEKMFKEKLLPWVLALNFSMSKLAQDVVTKFVNDRERVERSYRNAYFNWPDHARQRYRPNSIVGLMGIWIQKQSIEVLDDLVSARLERMRRHGWWPVDKEYLDALMGGKGDELARRRTPRKPFLDRETTAWRAGNLPNIGEVAEEFATPNFEPDVSQADASEDLRGGLDMIDKIKLEIRNTDDYKWWQTRSERPEFVIENGCANGWSAMRREVFEVIRPMILLDMAEDSTFNMMVALSERFSYICSDIIIGLYLSWGFDLHTMLAVH